MAQHVIQGEDGKKHVIEAPDDATPDEVLKFAEQAIGGQSGPQVGKLESLRRGAAQGLTFGFRDELYGALKGAYDYATGNDEFGKSYARNRDDSRALDAQAQQANPGTYFAGELVGSLPVPGAVAKAGFAPLAKAAGEGLKARTMAAAGEGAAYGALYGAGKGEGLEGTAEGAITGGIGGGLVGSALPAAGDLVGGVYRGVTQPFRAAINPKQMAAEKYAEAAARDNAAGSSSVPAALARADQRLVQNAPMEGGAMAADFGGENTRNLMRTAANIPSTAAEQLRKKLDSRQGFQWKRIENEIEKGLGNGSRAFQQMDVMEEYAKKKAGPLFEQAYASPLPMTEKLSEVLGRPHVRRLYELTVEQLQNEGKNVAEMPPLKVLHMIKMQVDRQIGQVKRGIQDSKANWDARTLTKLKNDLKDAIEVPVYKQALETYAGPMAVRNAIEDGMDEAFRLAPEELAAKMRKMSKADRDWFRMGAARAIMGKVRTGNTMRDRTENLFGSPDMQKRLRALYPNVKSYRDLQRRLVMEAKMSDTRKAVQGNSTTAKQLAQADEAGQPMRAAHAAGSALMGKLEPVVNYLSRQAQRFHGITPAVADEIIRIGMSRQPMNSRAWRRAVSRAEREPIYRAKLIQRLIAAGASVATPQMQSQ